MAAVHPTSSQQQTRSSRSQTASTCIPLQTRAAPSTLQTPTSQSITPQSHTQLVPVPKPPTSRRIWNEPLTGNMITGVALVVALIFGIGAWIGQAYGNTYARKSYEVTLWGLCLDHPAIQENEVCHGILGDGLHQRVKRDLCIDMQPSAYSQVNDFVDHLSSLNTCILATTLRVHLGQIAFYNFALLVGSFSPAFLHTYVSSFIWCIYIDSSFNSMEQRWKQRLLSGVCAAIATIPTASIAQILWYCSMPTGHFGAVPGPYSLPCLLTCLGLIMGQGFLDTGYRYRMKYLSSWSYCAIPYTILGLWFNGHAILSQLNDNDIELLLSCQLLFFFGCFGLYCCCCLTDRFETVLHKE